MYHVKEINSTQYQETGQRTYETRLSTECLATALNMARINNNSVLAVKQRTGVTIEIDYDIWCDDRQMHLYPSGSHDDELRLASEIGMLWAGYNLDELDDDNPYT